MRAATSFPTPPKDPPPPPPPRSQIPAHNAQRPGYGDTGERIMVKGNFFPMGLYHCNQFFHYDVSMTPEVPPKRARQVWKVFEGNAKVNGLNTRVVFDGRANAYTIAPIEEAEPSRVFMVEMLDVKPPPKHHSVDPKDRPRNLIAVKLTLVATLEMSELNKFLARKGPMTNGCITVLQALNVTLSHKVQLEHPCVGRSVHQPDGALDLGGGAEKWNGTFISVRPGQSQCFVNIDTTATAFIKSGNAVGVVGSILGKDFYRDAAWMDQSGISQVMRVLEGAVFSATHRGSSLKQRMKVGTVSERGADQTMFELQDRAGTGAGSRMSVSQYFSHMYGIRLKFPSLPCLGHQRKDGGFSYFPLEYCYIEAGQPYRKKLNEHQTAAMIKSTAVKPQTRLQNIRRAVENLEFRANPWTTGFGIVVGREMATIPARVLHSPTIQFAQGAYARPRDGAWLVNERSRLASAVTLKSWGILSFCDPYHLSKHDIERFVRLFVQVLSGSGINVVTMQPVMMFHNMMNPTHALDDARARIEYAHQTRAQIVVVILPTRCQVYQAIKAHGEVGQEGLITQCLLMNKVRKADSQYCRMVGLKMNTKLGGINHHLVPGSMPFLEKLSILLIGADVSHPAPDEHGRPSIVAVVGCMDHIAFRFVGRLRLQDSRQEAIDGLQEIVKEIIVLFKRRTQHYPKKILYYRDGVSETQVSEIVRIEVRAIKDACLEFSAQYLPPLTFTIVRKRHHARFFPEQGFPSDRSGNCKAGTVIDSDITHPSEFDFYLQSHPGLQGTSRATLYHVVLDENRFTADTFQNLTYALCHLYCRCPKSLSIVPMVRYAHLLSYRARYYGAFDDHSSMGSGGGYGNNNAQGQQSSLSTTEGPLNPWGKINIAPSVKDEMFFV